MSEKVRQVLRRQVKQALRRHDLAAAGDALERLRLGDPVSRQTRGLELELLLRSRRDAEAEVLAEQLLHQYPDSPRLLYLAAELAYRRKEYPRAEELATESERLHPHDETRHLLAQCLTQQGRFAEGERLLLELLPHRARCRRDLAWLYERRDEPERALAEVNAYLEHAPNDRLAQEQRLRLGARLAPEQLAAEVEGLRAVGEEVPEALLGELCEGMIGRGQQGELRRLLAERRPGLSPRAALHLGWICYRGQLHDLAVDLFLDALPSRLADVRLLSALEAAALRCRRGRELAERYEELAGEEPRLFGRLRNLRRRLADAPP